MVIHQSFSFVQVLSHHHFLELIEVHGAAAVLVHLLDDVVEVLLCQRVVDLAQDVLQHVVRDEPLALWQKFSWKKVTDGSKQSYSIILPLCCFSFPPLCRRF